MHYGVLLKMRGLPNCELSPLLESDLPSLIEFFTCSVSRHFLGGPLSSELSKSRSLDWISKSSEEPIWAIRNRTDEPLLGFVSITLHHQKELNEISYALLPRFYGQGFATAALTQALHLAFYEMKLSKLLAETQAKNKKSRQLLCRMGMIEEQRISRFGEEQIIYSIQNPDLSP